MPKVQIWAELSEEKLDSFEWEAKRRGVEVESLIEHTVNTLLRELERDEQDGTGFPIIPS